ncbi:hypothetical protein P5E51_15890, partial [Clostridium perfringens]|nr:hypothetical protein [Clostridium perfringens]
MGPVASLNFVVEICAWSTDPFDFLPENAVVKLITVSFVGKQVVDVEVSWAAIVQDVSGVVVVSWPLGGG